MSFAICTMSSCVYVCGRCSLRLAARCCALGTPSLIVCTRALPRYAYALHLAYACVAGPRALCGWRRAVVHWALRPSLCARAPCHAMRTCFILRDSACTFGMRGVGPHRAPRAPFESAHPQCKLCITGRLRLCGLLDDWGACEVQRCRLCPAPCPPVPCLREVLCTLLMWSLYHHLPL